MNHHSPYKSKLKRSPLWDDAPALPTAWTGPRPGPRISETPLVARHRGKSIQIDLNNKEDLLTQTLERLRGNELAARFDRARASVTSSPDSTLLRRAGRVRRPTSPKGRTAATSSGAHAHPRSRAGSKSLFSPGHGPKALSSTAVGGTSSSRISECVAQKMRRCWAGPPGDGGGLDRTPTCGCSEVPVGRLPEGELLGRRGGQRSLGVRQGQVRLGERGSSPPLSYDDV